MKIEITEDQLDKIKIANFSDLTNSGIWDPNIMTKVGLGKEPYVFIDGEFIKQSDSPRIRTNKVVYLSEKTAERFNKLVNKANELREESIRLKNQSKNILDYISQQVGREIK